jgi:hypothetical protein
MTRAFFALPTETNTILQFSLLVRLAENEEWAPTCDTIEMTIVPDQTFTIPYMLMKLLTVTLMELFRSHGILLLDYWVLINM